MKMATAIAYGSSVSVLIPLTLMVFIRDTKHALSIPILLILVASGVADLLSIVVGKQGLSTLPIINAYYVVQFCALCYFYSKLLVSRRKVIAICAAAFIVYFGIITFYIQGIAQFQGIVRPVDSVLVIMLSCVYWYDIYMKQPTLELVHYPPFWFNSAVFMYFAMNLFLFIIYKYLGQLSEEAARATWVWHNLNNIIKNVLFAVGIFYMKRN